jgi:outer membrane protein insertion porin family
MARAIKLDWLTVIGQGSANLETLTKVSGVTAKRAHNFGRKAMAALLLGSALTIAAMPVAAQTATTPAGGGIIKTISVTGSQRLEPDTVRSYIKLRPGAPYTVESLDAAIRDLFETELFADAQIRDNNGDLTIEIRENPVINRIVLEGNKRLKEDKIRPEIKLAPRQIFTRSKVRADVARIIELYRRQGRFAANVDPKMVMLDQNRVDVVFEITEGPKSKVRQINVIGNSAFTDGQIRAEMATKQSRFYRFLSSGDSYDPDKLAYDQAKLRQFYLTKGYADFRVVSAVAELTPDKRDFIVTYVIEEGERYKFGDVAIESDIRDFKPNAKLVAMKKGDWYNAKLVEDTVDSLTESAGLFGYAFAEVNPQFERDQEAKTMTLTLRIGDAPRVYIERVDVNGNTVTQDKVIRREFRLSEGDAFNTFQVKRSSDRIQSLGFFQEKLEIEQKPGSTPDRIVLEANVEEKSSGELQLSAGFSSLERFILNASIRQRNFRGKGQELRASVNYSSYSKSVELGFTEPYLFDRNIALGGDIFRRDTNSFNFTSTGARNTTYQQTTTGFQFRVGVPLTEFWSVAGRFGVSLENVTLDTSPTYYTNGACDPLKAGRFLCDAIGKRTTSTLGYSLVFDNLNNRLRPSSGQRVILSQDFAGLGGNVRYLRSRIDASKYWRPFGQFIFSVAGEGGLVIPFGSSGARSPSEDKIRLTDRFFLGEPEMRGFDIRGVGPRVVRSFYDTATSTVDNPVFLPRDNSQNTDDAIGGRAYYKFRAELEIPLGSGAKELGLRPSIFLDAGSVFNVREPTLVNGGLADVSTRSCVNTATGTLTSSTLFNAANKNPGPSCAADETATTTQNFLESFFGNSPKPRVSVGIGVNWNSPFGPFRIDLAKALVKQEGDSTKLFTFNVGTQF